ncbi:UMP-CMP kinase 2, mitochondrial-like [Macrosteles quadrilineatus]|uniref:UMP-CMP kinase 2, mitochondrial-like n=1 Tax=Macrosteles quadrilineatus TaxID=74068 RepID=UPI0023E34A76|nr:UMP-CMP kinase 2, mitochondrial-like [Macrosteles quadrilineatus]
MYYNNEPVQILLTKFQEVKQIAPQFLPEAPIRHPIIVIEGFFNHGKTKVTKIVADALHGRRFQLPNRNINKLRKYLNSDVLKKNFYSLSKYIGAYTAMYYCMTAPVIIERYWHDQAVYVMARSFEGIVPAKSVVYEFPKDLLRPDYIFFLNGALNPGVHNESTTKEHIHNPLTLKMVEVYRRMRDPALIEIYPPGMPEAMAEKILEILERELPTKFLPKPAMKPVLRPKKPYRPSHGYYQY